MQLNRVSLGCSLISVRYYLVLFIKVKIVGGGSRGGSIITLMWLLSTYKVVENLNSLSELIYIFYSQAVHRKLTMRSYLSVCELVGTLVIHTSV